MKRIFLSVLIGAGVVAAIFQVSSGSEAAGPPESYPLICRGGPTLPIYVAPGENNIGFKFNQAPGRASEGLLPGQCSWKDRRMSPSEPVRVSQHVEEGTAVAGAPKFPETLKVHLAPENRWYEELHSTEQYWTFMVYNDGLGQLIATSARRNDPTTTAAFTPSAEGLKTWVVSHEWHNDRWNCPLFFGGTHAGGLDSDEPAGQVLVGYINSYDGGSGPLPCESNSKLDFRGTIWFDLSELSTHDPLPLAEAATLKFKKVDGSVAAYDGNRKPITRVCDDRLFVSKGDSMKGFPEGSHVPEGDFIKAINECPPEGCSIDVTEVVNKWLTGKIDKYGFVIVGEDENWLDKLIPHDSSVCETRYGDFSLTVNYKSDKEPIITVVLPKPTPKPYTPIGETPPGGGKLDARKNYALTSNGGMANASSRFDLNYDAIAAINGDEIGVHKGSDPATGSFWHSALPGNTFPDYLDVTFAGIKLIDEIDVFTTQDKFNAPGPFDESTSFGGMYGLTRFEVQYMKSEGSPWEPVPGTSYLTGPKNVKIWNKFKISPAIPMYKIRVWIIDSGDGFSRIVELEAWGK